MFFTRKNAAIDIIQWQRFPISIIFFLKTYFVPKILSPASPRPGQI